MIRGELETHFSRSKTTFMENYKLVMPEDLNHHGFLFGGRMLQWVSE